ncbi:hypothetical protein GCM10022267_50110 [Lentzea roselyniae]|uniref:Uncharacterized protein n=1 Tax=Lentzea roselyniae TaxID=531940 RepID=A0ABP7BFZ2_9PSEU
MTAVLRPGESTSVRRLADDYDDLIRHHADDNGTLPEPYATEAAELAHQLRVLYADESDHWARLSAEHREGR